MFILDFKFQMLSFDIINIHIITLESQIEECPRWLNLLYNRNLHLKTLRGSVSFQYKINIFSFFIHLQTTSKIISAS
jgi:hypothetical protein